MTEGSLVSPQVFDVIREYWGFEKLRPLQGEAIVSGIEQRDSLVVLPTGGGKSLCYQVPPLVEGRTDIVISPLISLMQDQLDSLTTSGYPAAALHSAQKRIEKQRAIDFLRTGQCRLLLVSPERVLMPSFLEFADQAGIRNFAVDEAHCISHWGHDFRKEYRQLAQLKSRLDGCTIHAFTATATRRVRQDIIDQLQLEDPRVLVGDFDRPNLIYRILPRQDLKPQVLEVLKRHPREAVIIYCITRAETTRLTDYLVSQKIRAAAYHAGMAATDRRQTQQLFSNEEIEVVVATVAFGMGIDRSDVRCVIHAGMPKSIEHYQQETGRAGRDGLEAECVLFYSPADLLRWKGVVEKSSLAARAPDEVLSGALRRLEEMRRYCQPGVCRHRILSNYFGQEYEATDCQACDVCLNESGQLEDGTVLAQKILSCVARVGERYGIGHVVDVLRGGDSSQIQRQRHHELSTFGLLKEVSRSALINQIYQLVDQGLVNRTSGEYPVLQLTATSIEVLKGKRTVQLMPVRTKKVRRTAREVASWQGVDRDLFEKLRELRYSIATQRGVPPYVIFGDASLRDMARHRPANEQDFLQMHGVGQKKLADFGAAFLAEIANFEASKTQL